MVQFSQNPDNPVIEYAAEKLMDIIKTEIGDDLKEIKLHGTKEFLVQYYVDELGRFADVCGDRKSLL